MMTTASLAMTAVGIKMKSTTMVTAMTIMAMTTMMMMQPMMTTVMMMMTRMVMKDSSVANDGNANDCNNEEPLFVCVSFTPTRTVSVVHMSRGLG